MTLEPHGWLEALITSKEGYEIEIPVSFLDGARIFLQANMNE